MPLVRIFLKKSVASPIRHAIGDAVHRAMAESINMPAGDRFQIISDHGEDLIYDPGYLGIERTDGMIIIQISLVAGRTVEMTRALYRGIVELPAEEIRTRLQDVFIGLIEVPKENWSFGNGEAQYGDITPPHLSAPPQ